MHAPTPSVLPIALDDVRRSVRGDVLAPDHPDYDAARTLYYGGLDRRPALIVRPADATDVAQVVRLAGDADLDLAVKGGGHGVAGHGVIDGGLVLDLSSLRRLEVDAGARTVWAQTGLTAGAVTEAAARHGLAVGFGDSGSVGIGGITLGGGIGFLSRAHGLTHDQLLAAKLVTADGRIRHVDADTEPELFWAIRGGGGNFGVATALHYRLAEVTTVHGGMLALPASAEVIAGLVAAADEAPDSVSTIANVMVAPPLPFLPEELHGQLVVIALIVHAGPESEADAAIAPFRALARPLFDDVRSRPYPELYTEEPADFHPRAALRTFYRDTLDAGVAATILERLALATAPMAAVQLRVLGGAIGRLPLGATAYAHRGRRIMVNVAAMFEGDEERARHEDWVTDSHDALREEGVTGAYLNFVGADGPARIHEVYPGATLERLRAAKRRWDPDGLFRHNLDVAG
ncbi:FAD-binding oxidoreductase [Egicoccus sp. AB-alg2]|uniref:FAD-binding oxidoreductase n=1 Tax=Egicoccus sp. AB-alg2 TaxID=3242693 RepID=UPI00359DB9BF